MLEPSRRLWAGLALSGLLLACGPGAAAPASRPPPADGAGSASSSSAGPAPSSAVSAPEAAPPRARLRIAYSELTAGQVINWVTQEAGIYASHGLDAEQSYVPSAQTAAAVLAGEMDVGLGGGYVAVASRVAGSDLTIFVGGTNWMAFVFQVVPEITTPDDLRGKIIGISRFGSSSDNATRMALNYFGLDPEKDVTLIQTGSLQERVAAMQSGALHGAVALVPQSTLLRRLGFKTLLDLRTIGEEEMNNQGYATSAWLDGQEAAAQAFVEAEIEGLYYARTHREFAEAVIAQYLKLDDAEMVAESYDYYVTQRDDRTVRPAVNAARKYLASLAATDPRAASVRLEDAVTTRFVDRAVASGLIERLYGEQ
ncbi:MAG TPA: ABC transporter substrate-binding protein [Chloroflexota bacterium]|jgi:ABC-type nitrate/sulfonate/bicarbonate transport system substrate-binding protein